MRKQFAFIVGLMLCSAAAQAQTVISESEFRQLVERKFAKGGCTPVFTGKITWRLARTHAGLRALHKAGVVSVAYLDKRYLNEPVSWTRRPTQAASRVWVKVALREDVDAAQIGRIASGPCLKVPPVKLERIVRIDHVQGGAARKWDGSVVHATLRSAPRSALFAAYMANLPPRHRVPEHAKARVLLRFDPSSSAWRHLAEDLTPIDAQRFRSDNVEKALRRD